MGGVSASLTPSLETVISPPNRQVGGWAVKKCQMGKPWLAEQAKCAELLPTSGSFCVQNSF